MSKFSKVLVVSSRYYLVSRPLLKRRKLIKNLVKTFWVRCAIATSVQWAIA